MPSSVTAFLLSPLLKESIALRDFATSLLQQASDPSSNEWAMLQLVALPSESQITFVSSGKRGAENHRIAAKMQIEELPEEVTAFFRLTCPGILDDSNEAISQSSNLLTEVMPSCAGLMMLTPSSIISSNYSRFAKLASDLVDDPQEQGNSIAIGVRNLPEDLAELLTNVHPKNWQSNLFDQLSSNTDEIVFGSQIQECQLDGRWDSLGSKVFVDEYRDSRFERNNRIVLLSLRQPFEKGMQTRTMGSVIANLAHAVALREIVEAVNTDERLQPLLRNSNFREIYATSRQADSLRELDRLVQLDDNLDIDRVEIAKQLKRNPNVPQLPSLLELISRMGY